LRIRYCKRSRTWGSTSTNSVPRRNSWRSTSSE